MHKPTRQRTFDFESLCRYLAEQMVEHPERDDCYIARLLVKQVSPKDSKRYFLDVENVHGTDRYAVALTVKGTTLFHEIRKRNIYWKMPLNHNLPNNNGMTCLVIL